MRRKSYGLTKERAERISINTEKAYLEKYKENKMSQEFNFKLSVLAVSVLDVMRRIRAGEDVNQPVVEYPEPEDE